MRRLDHVLSRIADRGDPLGADLLIERLERTLAGEPDPIVVARQRSGIMQTADERTTRQPGPPTPRRGLAMALASFIVVVIAGSGILLWAVLDGSGGSDPASPSPTTTVATTEAPSTTQAAPVTAAPVGTFSFDGTTWSYDGPSTLEAGMVTFSLVNTSSERVAVVSWFGLEGEELAAELATAPIGTDIGDSSDAPPPPPSDFVFLVEAGPGESVSATTVMGAGEHLIDGATMAAGAAAHLWRVALIEVAQPESLPVGEVAGTFTFDGTTWDYDGPSTLEAGMVTFELVNAGDVGVGVYSWFGLEGEELAAELAIVPIGTAIGPQSDAPPHPPSDYLVLFEVGPGETVSATTVMGAGDHLIDAATLTASGGVDELWRVALIEVAQP